MEVCFVLGKWLARETDVVAVEEVIGYVRGLVGLAGVLGFAGDVNASENHLPALRVAEFAIFDCKTKAGHGPCFEWLCVQLRNRRGTIVTHTRCLKSVCVPE